MWSSPDGKLTAVPITFSARPLNGFMFVDISQGRKFNLVIRGLCPGFYWWQSNTDLGYLDQDHSRHIVRVR